MVELRRHITALSLKSHQYRANRSCRSGSLKGAIVATVLNLEVCPALRRSRRRALCGLFWVELRVPMNGFKCVSVRIFWGKTGACI